MLEPDCVWDSSNVRAGETSTRGRVAAGRRLGDGRLWRFRCPKLDVRDVQCDFAGVERSTGDFDRFHGPPPTTPAPEEEIDFYDPIDVGYQFERTTWIVEANSITSEPPRQVELSDGSATVVPFELQVSAVAFTSDLAPTYGLATPTAGRLGVVDIGPAAVGDGVDTESESFLVGLQALPDSHSLYGARYAVMFVVVGSDLEPEFVGRAADEGLDRQLAALAQVTGSPSLAHSVAAWQTAVAASNEGDQAQLTLLRDAVHTSVP